MSTAPIASRLHRFAKLRKDSQECYLKLRSKDPEGRSKSGAKWGSDSQPSAMLLIFSKSLATFFTRLDKRIEQTRKAVQFLLEPRTGCESTLSTWRAATHPPSATSVIFSHNINHVMPIDTQSHVFRRLDGLT